MLPHRSARAASVAAAALALAAPNLADSEEYAAQIHLESTAVVPGVASTLRLRSPLPNHGVVLFLGSAPLGLPLGGAFPVLGVAPPFLGTFLLNTGPGGLAEVPFTFAASVPPSVTLYTQAFLVTSDVRVLDSNVLGFTPSGSPAVWTEATGQLPPETDQQLGIDVDFADFDKDGDLDAISVGDGDAARPLYLVNDGSGTFTEASDLRLPASARIPCAVVEIADVNGDGWDDLFLGGAYDTAAPAPNLLLLNDGTGSFTEDPTFPTGAGRPLDAEFADVDGDEDLDLVLLNLEEVDFSETVAAAEILTNDGGSFSSALQFSTIPPADPHTGGGGISLADFDNDADLDVVLVRADASLGYQNELWVNDGLGGFTETTATSLPVVADNSHDVSVLDANGDGLLDFFVYNSIASVPSANHLLLNTGGSPPVFVSGDANVPASFGALTNIRFSGDAADVDRDGDTDLLVGVHALPFGPFPSTDGESVLLLNQGGIQGGVQGEFLVDPGFEFAPAYIDGDPSFADVDGDGDPDLYLGNGGDIYELLPPQDRLFLNQL